MKPHMKRIKQHYTTTKNRLEAATIEIIRLQALVNHVSLTPEEIEELSGLHQSIQAEIKKISDLFL